MQIVVVNRLDGTRSPGQISADSIALRLPNFLGGILNDGAG